MLHNSLVDKLREAKDEFNKLKKEAAISGVKRKLLKILAHKPIKIGGIKMEKDLKEFLEKKELREIERDDKMTGILTQILEKIGKQPGQDIVESAEEANEKRINEIKKQITTALGEGKTFKDIKEELEKDNDLSDIRQAIKQIKKSL